MLKVFLLINILLVNLYACKGGYHSCKRKINDLNVIVNQNLQIPISKKQTLIYTRDVKTLKNYKIIKEDPFLSLYLVKSKKYVRYPFKLNKHYSLGVASVNKNMAQEGKLRKKQVGLNKLALFNDAVFTPSLLITSCCSLEGLITGRGIIEKDYIKNFLDSKKLIYGDIGVRLKNINGSSTVIASDPFMKNNFFKKGDVIKSFDGKRLKDSYTIMRKILFSKIAKVHKIIVKRATKLISFTSKTSSRFGGGFISDTFLEQKGLYFDKDLFVTKIDEKLNIYGLKIGDKLIQANGVKVDTQELLREYIGDFKESSLLLFQRAGFQFFVHIN